MLLARLCSACRARESWLSTKSSRCRWARWAWAVGEVGLRWAWSGPGWAWGGPGRAWHSFLPSGLSQNGWVSRAWVSRWASLPGLPGTWLNRATPSLDSPQTCHDRALYELFTGTRQSKATWLPWVWLKDAVGLTWKDILGCMTIVTQSIQNQSRSNFSVPNCFDARPLSYKDKLIIWSYKTWSAIIPLNKQKIWITALQFGNNSYIWKTTDRHCPTIGFTQCDSERPEWARSAFVAKKRKASILPIWELCCSCGFTPLNSPAIAWRPYDQ